MNAFRRLDIPHRVQFRVRSVGAMAHVLPSMELTILPI
ncbi:hypothetical protein X769_02195 [Mesorhizobium sp. LSJC268A00]|nr:hypothetical protein X769_02195 [Mesorhizobium sp. LSJC268A00]